MMRVRSRLLATWRAVPLEWREWLGRAAVAGLGMLVSIFLTVAVLWLFTHMGVCR